MQRFLFNGRLIFGPDAKSLVVTILLIVVPVIIFCTNVSKNLINEFPASNAGYVILAVAILFTIYVSAAISSPLLTCVLLHNEAMLICPFVIKEKFFER